MAEQRALRTQFLNFHNYNDCKHHLHVNKIRHCYRQDTLPVGGKGEMHRAV